MKEKGERQFGSTSPAVSAPGRWLSDDGNLRQIGLRYLDLLILGCVAVVLFGLLEPLFDPLAKAILGTAGWGHPCWPLAVAVVVASLLWGGLRRLGGGLHWRRFTCGIFRNPPVWAVGLLSATAYYELAHALHFGPMRFLSPTTFVGAVVLLLGCGIGVCTIERILQKEAQNTAPVHQSEKQTLADLSKDAARVIEWIQKEEPICSPADDRFGRNAIAKRIARVIEKDPIKTVGLIGPYGSGKTCILRMVESYLVSDNRTVVCWVSGWGFREGSAAEHILTACLRQLARYTDCTSVVQVPTAYQNALAQTRNGLAEFCSSLLRAQRNTQQTLELIDRLLAQIARRMVIFLEDIDRNRRTDVFFNEISALLEGIKNLKNVTFVLAIGGQFNGQEVLVKVAEHIDAVPSLDRSDVIRTVKVFREHCLSQLDGTVRRLLTSATDDHLGIERSDLVEAMAAINKNLEKPIDAIARLLHSPRSLKLVLRRTFQAWGSLRNEINFDDLLMANVLRVAAPEGFMFVNNNIPMLQYVASNRKDSSSDAPKDQQERLKREFQRLAQSVEWDIQAARGILDHLFPHWSGEQAMVLPSSTNGPHREYQYVENRQPTDYWSRLMCEELGRDEIGDAEILRAIERWNDNWEHPALQGLNMREALLDSEHILHKMTQFKTFINGDSLRSVASQQFRSTLETRKNKASSENCPGPEWGVLLKPDIREIFSKSEWIDWVTDEIIAALPISLRYANDLYAFWMEPERSHPHSVRRVVVKKAKQIYVEKPEILVHAIDSDCFSITHFARQYSESKHGGEGFDPKAWRWLGKVLLAAAKVNPDVIVPQLAALVGGFVHRPNKKDWEYNLSESILSAMFQNDSLTAVRLIASDITYVAGDDDILHWTRLAQTQARQWLVDHAHDK